MILTLSQYLEQQDMKDLAVELLKKAHLKNQGNAMLQARYLSLLTDVDFTLAERLQQTLEQPDMEDDREGGDGDFIQQLIEEAMPEHKKVKKTTDMDV